MSASYQSICIVVARGLRGRRFGLGVDNILSFLFHALYKLVEAFIRQVRAIRGKDLLQDFFPKAIRKAEIKDSLCLLKFAGQIDDAEVIRIADRVLDVAIEPFREYLQDAFFRPHCCAKFASC